MEPKDQTREHESDEEMPRLAIRRPTDRCFFEVEELVPGPHGGYIVEGVLIHRDEVAQVVELGEDGAPPACAK